MKELTYPLSTELNRRTFLEGIAISTGTNLLATAFDREVTDSAIPILEDTAETLTQNRQLVTQYLRFREGFRDDGHDVSQYSIWSAVEHFGLIQSLSYANRNPWISPQDSAQTSSAITSMHNKIAHESLPNYAENIRKDRQAGFLGLLTAGSIYLLNQDFKDSEKASVDPQIKMNRRSFMNAMAIGFGAINVASTIISAGRLSQYDLINRPSYHNIPGKVLRQLSTENETQNFFDYFNSSLSSLPSPEDTQLMTRDEFYKRQNIVMDMYDQAWSQSRTPEETATISNKALTLRGCTFDSYKVRFDAIQNIVNNYFPKILQARPESPILSHQFSKYPTIKTTGIGLALFDTVQRNHLQMNFDLQAETIIK